MIKRSGLFAWGLSLAALGACAAPVAVPPGLEARVNADAPAVKYENGLWYAVRDGAVVFEPGARYAVDGVFVDAAPEPYETVDLGGLYIAPPYGEAHNHSVDGESTAPVAEKYMREGVFYYKNPNSVFSFTQPHRDLWARPETMDLSFAYAGLTKDEGHPEPLYRMLVGFGAYPGLDAEALDGEAVHTLDTLEALDARWADILAAEPDFLKLYLLQHDTAENDGLSEEVFREIVARARAAGVRTAVHVETAQDLALAVEAGADEAAHLPAYDVKFARDEAVSRIPDALVEAMAARGFVTVATVNVARNRNYTEEELAIVTARQADNLARIHAAGAPIAVGSDTFTQTALNEVQSLKALGVFEDETVFRFWVETPGLTIFPGRAIGRLAPGYEASFLALRCDPTADLACAQEIAMGVKQGVALDLWSEAPPADAAP